jgi:hypothetical protein
MKRPYFERIPELLRPQNCAAHVSPGERPCPTPAEWYSTGTGNPYCEAHKNELERLAHQREITPP